MTHTRKKRIFIGLTEIGGYYAALEKGLKGLGEEVIFINAYEHPFRYGSACKSPLVKILQFCTTKRLKSPPSSCGEFFWLLSELPLRFLLLIWTISIYDVFIFGSNCTFFRFLELPLLKLCRKRIICVFHGSDSRPHYISGLAVFGGRNPTVDKYIKLSRRQKRTLKWVERFADIIINHPPTAHFLEKPFIQWLHIGIPQYLFPSPAVLSPPSARPLRIVHAPSRPECKGTATFRQIIKNMAEKNIALEFVELIGRPNEEVLEELAKCDLVIDELYSDTPMASFASEAAIFAKPSVVGGYATFEDLGELPPEIIPPTVYCRPEKVGEFIEKLLVDAGYRLAMGRKAFEFIKNQWSAETVARRFQMLINDTYPRQWLYRPKRIRYLHGWGLSEEKCKDLVRAVITKGGKEALQLKDKPDLEKAFLKFAGISQ